MTQEQINSRISDLRPHLEAAKASGDTKRVQRVLAEMELLSNMWWDIEMARPTWSDEIEWGSRYD